MIHLKQAVIVEGKYDKIKLSNFIDAEIIVTDGFRIFKNAEKKALIRRIAEKRGIIIMTDSDGAGFMIRGHLSGLVPPESITNVFIPQISGKEKRKTEPSAAGYLGVEGLDEQTIITALKNAGVDTAAPKRSEKITSADLFLLGLSGKSESRLKREQLQQRLNLPIGMSTNQLLTALNSLYSRNEFLEMFDLKEGELK